MQAWAAPDLPALPGRGYPLRVHDTSTGQLRPLAPGAMARMYVCGITPYDATHLGHAATYLTFDVLARGLRDAGHELSYAQNVTDVDDPLLARAERDGEDWRALAEREIAIFRADMTALRVLPPQHFIGAVEAIPVVTAMVTRLLERGAAYSLEGDIYFAVSAAPRFGEVSRYDRDTMLALSRKRGGDPDRMGKKDPLDPVLWLTARPGEPAWPAPFGAGRPGWHVECAAIAVEYLGASFDVQGGGTDLVFPHHELTAAHATAATGEWPFARAYVHQSMVGFDGHKMSKSRGNLVRVSQLRAAGDDPMALRLALLDHAHGADWDWTPSLLPHATQRLAAWRNATAADHGPSADQLLEDIRRAVADNLNTPGALAAMDRWVAEAARHAGRDPQGSALARAAVDALLGISLHQ